MAVQNKPPAEATDDYLRPARSLSPGEGYRCGSRGAYFVLPSAAILFSGGLEGPARQDWELRHWAAAKTRLEQRPMTEGPRRYASLAHRNFLIYFLSSVLSVVEKESRGQVFILVYRLAIDVRTWRGDDGGGGKVPVRNESTLK